ncbi:hypothetical protein GCM10027399_30020 [Curvibacter fontanus]|jgi:hypothetical protein
MNAAASFNSHESGDLGPGPAMGMEVGRLRDAGCLPAFQGDEGLWQPGRTQLLHRWTLSPGQRAAGLLFQPLGGSPRHGVLALFVDQGELHGAIEILERQGCWLVVPDDLRARTLAVAALARAGGRTSLRSSIVGTPDRRFIFFNTQGDGATATLVERRRDGGAVVT